MTSQQIVKAIEESHSKDVVVPECKDGPTWSTSHSRMDVWVMKRSWSSPRITGYEIKVSKADFKNDNKWPAYLPLCNQLYFVCPKGLIEPSEIPGGVGLKYCLGSRLREIKKAEYREIVPPESLFLYLLMCRTRVVAPHHHDAPDKSKRLEEWRSWLAEKEEGRRLGYQVSRSLRDRVDRVESENRRLKTLNDFYAEVKLLAEKYGLGKHTWRLEEKVQECSRMFPQSLLDELRGSASHLKSLADEVEKLNGVLK